MSEKNILEVSRDLGQCTGGNWSPVQGMTPLAGIVL